MELTEPTSTAVILGVLGILLGLSGVLSQASSFTGVPVVLLFLTVGVLAGSEAIGGIYFDNYHLAFRVGTASLALILFDGGLNTPRALLRWLRPALVLATFGVILTATIVGAGAFALGFPWLEAMLLGAVISSTDAAAVFAIFRGSRTQLRQRVAGTLELESGLNDPVAVILTMSLSMALANQSDVLQEIVVGGTTQLVIGGAFGFVLGRGGRWLLGVLKLPVEGLYPVLTLALALLTFSGATLLGGSGFLAVYLAGVTLGSGPLPYRLTLLRSHDFLAWFSQVFMFLILGLLVFPSQLVPVAFTGTMIALVLMLLARPLAVAICLAPFGYPLRETAYVAWAGLRGAVPIVLATVPLLVGVKAGQEIFNVVFFVVVLNVVLQGGSVRWIAQWLRIDRPAPPLPSAAVEISTRSSSQAEVLSFFIDPVLAVAGAKIADLALPAASSILLVVRGDDLIAPRGDVVLEPRDHVYVLCQPRDRAFIRLLFGQQEED